MFEKIKKNEGLVFIIKIISIYLLWTIVRLLFTNIAVLEPSWIAFNDFFAAKYVAVSSWILEHWFNYDLIYNKRNILPKGETGIYVGNHCIGISAKFIFILIISSLKGRWFDKVWFILLGVFIILSVNTLRIVLLAMQLTEGKHFLFDLNHRYTFVYIVYGIIFGLIMIWEKYFSHKKS